MLVIHSPHSKCSSMELFQDFIVAPMETLVLISTLKQVPAGTNGGVSSLGLTVGFLGSLLIGLVCSISFTFFCGVHPTSFLLILFSVTLSGVLGNLLDSFLGSTLQYSGFDTVTNCVVRQPGENVKHISGRDVLGNSEINIITSSVAGLICGGLFLVLKTIM
ncbi:hypothetical protein EIN_359430 [Entamoeba invadens IP1]|uniref:Transmembrane protein n=1 Tax=Entamoeba invadens IP1 TaxID=370355 RepID=A0A0A1U7U4_ENTIV|nr:hypothetical protein EIN_359430 [Entamoeba invadens IP1]ELP90860.1 hypothetical protein EIN_359430 [Entamoeba invadens IP1]|eukprot:XP_004257631.1 hypothetical protein EIN_359430 [Entamoeba invadens IP1]